MAGHLNAHVTAYRVRLILQTDLGAQLTSVASALTTLYGETIDLPAVDQFWSSPQSKYPKKVNVVVVPADMDRQYRGSERLNEQPILIGLLVSGNDRNTTFSPTELLTIRLWGYAQALVQTLEAKPTLTISGTDHADQLLVDRLIPSELGPADDTPGFEQRMQIDLTVRTS